MKLFALLLIVDFGLGTFPAAAANPPALPLSPDIQLIADFAQNYVRELAQPVYVYNWNDGTPNTWIEKPRAEAFQGFRDFQASALTYWKNQKLPDNAGELYGNGFYVALDPVISRDYGGAANWVLTQVVLPAGFRILDLITYTNTPAPMPPAITQAMIRLGCPEILQSGAFLRNMMKPQRYLGYPACADAIEAVMATALQINAFIYPFHTAYFTDCDSSATPGRTTYSPGSSRNGAFIITDGSQIKPKDVRYFSHLTNDDPEERVRIESLFYKAKAAASASGAFPYPAVISASNPPAKEGLLWPDLEGVNTDPNLVSWMKANLLGCGDQPAYK